GASPRAGHRRVVSDRHAELPDPESRGATRADRSRGAGAGGDPRQHAVRRPRDGPVDAGDRGRGTAGPLDPGPPSPLPQGPVVLPPARGEGLMDLRAVPRRSPNSAYRIYDGQATIVLPDRAEVNVLNEIGSLVWDRMDGRRTVAQLIEAVVAEFDVTPDE